MDKTKPDAGDYGALGKFAIAIAAVVLVSFAIFGWFEENEIRWGDVALWYFGIGALVGIFVAIGTFFGLWYWAAQRYEPWGFILGWLPSGVAAFVSGWLAVPLYGLALIALIVFWFRD